MSNNTNFLRQSDTVDMAKLQSTRVVIIGAGGIGSPTALVLAKMGIGNIVLVDKDVVETYNIPSQFHLADCLGFPKVESLKKTLEAFIKDVTVTTHFDTSKTEYFFRANIVVSAVDSMKSRKEIYEQVKEAYSVSTYIEGRMGSEMGLIYTINNFHLNKELHKEYEKTLYSDENAVQESCTNKAIIYNTTLMGSIIAAIIKQVLCTDIEPKYERILDSYNIALM